MPLFYSRGHVLHNGYIQNPIIQLWVSLSLFFSFFQSPKFTSTFTAWNVVTARLLMYTTYKQTVTGMRELASAARTHLGSLHIKTLLFIPFISKIITVALSPRHKPSW